MGINGQLPPTNGRRVRTVNDWLERAPSEGTRGQYRRTVQYWIGANGFASAAVGIENIRAQRADIYDTSDRMVKSLLDRGLAPASVGLYRGILPLLFEFLSPRLDFDREEYDMAVRKVEVYKITEDRIPTRDEARRVLIHAPSHKSKAFVAIAVNTGRRLGEITSLRVRDIDFTMQPIRVYFRARMTKTKKEAVAFLTPEAGEMVQAHIRNRGFENQWLFPGTINNQPLDRPMSKSNAWKMVMETFAVAGLGAKDAQGRNVCDTGVEEFYKDWEEIGRSWREQCEQEFTHLTDRRDLEKIKTESETFRKDLDEKLKEFEARLALRRRESDELLDELVASPKFWRLFGRHVGYGIGERDGVKPVQAMSRSGLSRSLTTVNRRS